MKYNYLKIAEIIKEKRLESGMSQRQLASLVGIGHTEITRIENGTRTNFNLVLLIKLCNELGIDFVELLKTAGYLENNMIKNYRVVVQFTDEKSFMTRATNPNEAYKSVSEFVRKNHIFDNCATDLLKFTVLETNENLSDELDIRELFNEGDNSVIEESDTIYCPFQDECNYED